MSGRPVLTVLVPGPQTLVQDLGRPGHAALGVPPSGALDAPALRAANRLVGNRLGAPALEVLLGGLRVRASARCTVAVTGAAVPLHVGGRPVPWGAPVDLDAGDVLAVGRATGGVRCYLAVRGGLDVPPLFGSASTDLLSGLGPAPVRAGDELATGDLVDGDPGPLPGLRPAEPAAAGTPAVLQVGPGPRRELFDDEAWAALTGAAWTVTPDSNRVGLRLAGPSLHRTSGPAELPSEGLVTGAVQIPPSGQPVLFLADHPTTGGYPVLAVLARAALPVAGQLRPGAVVRFAGQG
ncbi:biotin-dependent carboxyltransferase family protein [Nakamurella endophytica]|uniref:Allophanate hydrolase n=1 Tax=Nakamurella endophytica TaxID=1748367 RepID=A0A917SWR0_9ACTN|nr:biotin-dependent carboxyltransferase family protein [Nakamurella endophytica]GGM01627.1 allophanate hydrolase [Nakamurella endophytica]